jgi:hypothetical protein
MSDAIGVRRETTVDAAENQRLGQRVCADLAATRPEATRYLTLRLADGSRLSTAG